MLKIEFSKSTLKELEKKLKMAIKIGNPGQIQKVCAIVMLAKEIDFTMVAEIWCGCERTLYNWIKDFLYKGIDCFTIVKRSGRHASITRDQKRRLCEIIDAGPEEYGFASSCWNSLMIKEVIKREFKVHYHRNYVCALLKQLGYSYQKGKFISDKQDEVERQLWRTVTWPELLERAKSQNASLLFLDEVSFPMWGSLGYTWGRIGEQPLVKTSGRRKNLKVFGALEYFSGKLVYKTEEKRLNSKSYIEFLKVLLKRFSGNIILIHDSASYHKSSAVKSFLLSHPRIQCFPLPKYSPDFNLIEYLWKKAKSRTHNKYFSTFDSLKRCVHSSLRYFQKNASEVLKLHGVYAEEIIQSLLLVA